MASAAAHHTAEHAKEEHAKEEHAKEEHAKEAHAKEEHTKEEHSAAAEYETKKQLAETDITALIHAAKTSVPPSVRAINPGSPPWARGDFEIDNYLKSLTPLQGVWVDGRTAYGNFYITDQNWGTYTRPIFAYLRYVDRYPVAGGQTITHTFTKRAGFTYSFTASISTTTSVGASIDIVNVSSEISTGFSATKAWSHETEESWSTSLQGPATFYCYQIVLVYAHQATSAANKSYIPPSFPHHRIATYDSRKDLIFVSSINRGTMLTTTAPVTPYTWDEVQQLVLFDGWSRWSFDYSAYNNNRY
jgi:hypothetical protein